MPEHILTLAGYKFYRDALGTFGSAMVGLPAPFFCGYRCLSDALRMRGL